MVELRDLISSSWAWLVSSSQAIVEVILPEKGLSMGFVGVDGEEDGSSSGPVEARFVACLLS